MNNKIVQIFLVFIIIMVLFGFSILLNVKHTSLSLITSSDNQTGNLNNQEPVLIVSQSYERGANIYSGSITIKDGCALNTGIDLKAGDPEKIIVNFNTDKEIKNCAVLAPKKDFTIVVPSTKTAQLEQIILNGTPIAFKIYPQ